MNGLDEHGECVEKWEQRFKDGKCTLCGGRQTACRRVSVQAQGWNASGSRAENPKAYEVIPPDIVGNSRSVMFGGLAGKTDASHPLKNAWN